MAQYNMINEIKEIQEITGKTFEELLDKFDGASWAEDIFMVPNRRQEASVKSTLAELKETKRKEENRKERLSTYHWIKEEGAWVVDGNFEGKRVGDEIEILKASGERQKRLIAEFTPTGKAIVK